MCTPQEAIVATAVGNRHASELQARGDADHRCRLVSLLTVEDAQNRVLAHGALVSRRPAGLSDHVEAVAGDGGENPGELTVPVVVTSQDLSNPLDGEGAMPRARDDEGDRKTLRQLQDAVAARSRELALPDGVLASRRWLQALLETGQWPAALAGWRRGQLEAMLAPLVEAKRVPAEPA